MPASEDAAWEASRTSQAELDDLKAVRSKKRAVFSEHLAERPGRPTRPSWTLGFVAGADEPGGAPVCAEEQQSVRRPGSRKAQQELEQQRADRSRDERATPETKEAALQRDTERGKVALQQHLMSRDKARLWLRRREQDLEQQVAAVAQERGAFAATLAGRGEALAGVSTGMSARRSSAASTATSGMRRPWPRGDARRASSSGSQRSGDASRPSLTVDEAKAATRQARQGRAARQTAALEACLERALVAAGVDRR